MSNEEFWILAYKAKDILDEIGRLLVEVGDGSK